MSVNFRTALKYWFWLIVGIALISMQVYKYWNNTLEYTVGEGIVLFIGMMFMIKPTMIPDYILKIIGKNK